MDSTHSQGIAIGGCIVPHDDHHHGSGPMHPDPIHHGPIVVHWDPPGGVDGFHPHPIPVADPFGGSGGGAPDSHSHHGNIPLPM